MARSSATLSPHPAIALTLVAALSAHCRRASHPPPVAPEPRALDSAIDSAVDSNTTPADARDRQTASDAHDARDSDAAQPPSPTTLRESSFVSSAMVDLPMRAPAAPTIPATRSGRAPSLAAAITALRAGRSSAARFVPEGAFLAVGDGRFALVTQRTDRGFRHSPAFELHLFSESDGRAQLEASAQAPTAYLFVGASGSTGCAPAILARELRDFDRDGEPELLLVLRYCSFPSCVSGYRAFEYTLVYDLTPGPRLALMLERRIRTQAHENDTRSRTLVFRDTNSDGHPDAIARGRDCLTNVDRWLRYVNGQSEAPADEVSPMDCQTPELACADNAFSLRDCSDRSETALYDPATDAWRLATDGAEPLPDRDCSGQPLSEGASEP